MSKFITAYVGTRLEINERLQNGEIQYKPVNIDFCESIYTESREEAYEYSIVFETTKGERYWTFRNKKTRNDIFAEIAKNIQAIAIIEKP